MFSSPFIHFSWFCCSVLPLQLYAIHVSYWILSPAQWSFSLFFLLSETYLPFIYLSVFFSVAGLELRASCLLGRCSTTCVTPLANLHFLKFYCSNSIHAYSVHLTSSSLPIFSFLNMILLKSQQLTTITNLKG
jgi:hypothetical protein